MTNNIDEKDLYYCYSINLLNFLKEKGFRYLCKGFNENKHKKYWVFKRSDEFHEYLHEFTENKKKNLNKLYV